MLDEQDRSAPRTASHNGTGIGWTDPSATVPIPVFASPTFVPVLGVGSRF